MKKTFFTISIALLCVMSVYAQDKKYPEPPKMVPEMTEFWTPQPEIVTPADMDKPVAPPSDALVLFDSRNFDEWESDRAGSAIGWTIADGAMTVGPRTGGIHTKREFGDFQLHIEWRSPSAVSGESQGRGNSGIFLQGMYELQVLDNYDNETYVNGMAGSLYKQSRPLVNAVQKPGKWNVYEVIYTAPRFREDGTIHTHGRVTVLLNGVLVQNNTMLLGTTEYIGPPQVKPHGNGPISLQDHGNLVSFRNIWIREL